MAEPSSPPQERLQPALLDRLTDDEPDKKQEPREARVLSKQQLRAAVLRDLAWLFNTTRARADRSATIRAKRAACARQSVLNYGLPALSGQSRVVARRRRPRARRPRRRSCDFEPRILPRTLRDRALLEAGELDHHNVIGVEIHGQLWAQPVPLELLVRTEIDLETGTACEIADLDSPAAGVPDGSPPAAVLQPRAAAPARDGRRVRAAVPEDRRAGSAWTAWRSPIPYVERLLEGVGFLAARVQLKLDAEFPRFTQALLEIVYPHYLAPTPSMLVAQLQPDAERSEPGRRRPTVPRGTHAARPLAARRRDRAASSAPRTTSRCWPIEIVVGELLLVRARPAARRAADRAAHQGRRCASGCKTTAGLSVRAARRSIACRFYLGGRDDVANKLHELLLATRVGVLVRPPARRRRSGTQLLPATRDPAGRLRRRRGAAAGDARVVPGLPPAAGVLLVSAALPASSS